MPDVLLGVELQHELLLMMRTYQHPLSEWFNYFRKVLDRDLKIPNLPDDIYKIADLPGGIPVSFRDASEVVSNYFNNGRRPLTREQVMEILLRNKIAEANGQADFQDTQG